MAGTVTISLTADDFEQGSIGSSGNSSSDTNIRTTAYIPFHSDYINVTVSAISGNGNALKIDFLGYTGNTTTSPVCDLYWYDSPHTFDLSSYSNIRYCRLVIKKSDGSAMIPSEISSCEITINYNTYWKMNEDNYPVQVDAPILSVEKSMEKPYPYALWRVEQGVNSGLPFNMLIPIPRPPAGIVGVINGNKVFTGIFGKIL